MYLSESITTNVGCSSSASNTVQPSPTGSTSTDPQTAGTAHHDVNAGVIVGPIVVVVVALLALVVGIIFWRRHKRMSSNGGTDDNISPAPWYGAYNGSHTSDREKGGINTLSMPTQGFNGSSVVVNQPFNPYGSPTVTSPSQQSTTQLSSVHASQMRRLPSPPTAVSPPSSDVPASVQQRPEPPGVDVNAIIELIAQRIDRPPLHPSVAPPQYPS